MANGVAGSSFVQPCLMEKMLPEEMRTHVIAVTPDSGTATPTEKPKPTQKENARRADRERGASLRNVDLQALLSEGDQKEAPKQYAVFKRVSMSDVDPKTQLNEFARNRASPRYIFNRYRLQAIHEARSRGEQIAWAVSPYPQLNREFLRISLAWINLPESVEIGCAASSNAIDNFFREPGKIGFTTGVIQVLEKHSHLEIDCLDFGKLQRKIVFETLKIRIKARMGMLEEECPAEDGSLALQLHRLWLGSAAAGPAEIEEQVEVDVPAEAEVPAKKKSPPQLHTLRLKLDLRDLTDSDKDLSEIRELLQDSATVFELHLCAWGGAWGPLPNVDGGWHDFSKYPELRSVDLRFARFATGPNFAKNEKLEFVSLIGCGHGHRYSVDPTTGPVFGENRNPKLQVDMRGTPLSHAEINRLHKELGENFIYDAAAIAAAVAAVASAASAASAAADAAAAADSDTDDEF